MKNLPSNTIPYIESILKDIEYGIQYDDGNFTELNNYKYSLKNINSEKR